MSVRENVLHHPAQLGYRIRMANRVRQVLVILEHSPEAPDPTDTPHYNQCQIELVDEMREKHILPDDRNQALMEYTENGDAKLYNILACAKKRLKRLFGNSKRLKK